MIILRAYRPDDAPALLALLALFRDTIRRVNSRDYSPAQVAAWASDDIDTEIWFGRFEGRFVAVAEEAGCPVGFAELEPDGHIDRVYVSADHQRRGIVGDFGEFPVYESEEHFRECLRAELKRQEAEEA